MKIIEDFPPNILDIKSIFPITGKEIFSWGDKIYNPSGVKISLELRAHEEVHSRQQGDDVQSWWDQYLIDDEFRFEQELLAHQVEFAVYSRHQPNRNLRRIYLRETAKRLSSPMYGSIVTFVKAKQLIKKGP